MTGQVIPREIACLQIRSQLPNRVGSQVLTVPVYVDLHFKMIRDFPCLRGIFFQSLLIQRNGFPFPYIFSIFEQKASIVSGQGEAVTREADRLFE
jgi:hypothetical protein